MSNPAIRNLLSFCILILSMQAFAHVGATSAGVTTSVPDPTQPSTNVQQQSSSFVRSNAQLAVGVNNDAATAGTHGTARTGTTGVAGTRANSADSGTPGQDQARKENGGKPGEPAAKKAPPPAPPPPPPIYKSVIRPISPANPGPAQSAPPPAPSEQASPPGTQQPPATPPPAPVRRASSMQRKPVAHKNPDKAAGAIKVPAYQADTSGRGDAPDGYTFPLGLLIAGLLLAFGLSTYLRIGRSEPHRNRQP